MGITGLLPLLKSIHRPCNLKAFSGLTLGIDAYGWLHRGTVACAIDLALDKQTTKFVEFAMHRVRMLIHFGVTPYLVFDGDYLPSKASTESDRLKRRAESKQLGLQLYRAGKVSQAHNELQKAIDVTPEMARQLIDELNRHSIQYVVAPYEADAQLAFLEREGYIQGIISEDSDLLVFGAKRLLTKLDTHGDCVEINRNDFTACRELHLVGWTDAQFRQMTILSGCDYLANISNMGLKTAYRLLRKYKKVEKVIQVLQFDAKFKVPNSYLENFKKAELTFIHQMVFCPKQQNVIMATDPVDIDSENLDFVGKTMDKEVARGVARGDLHPMTKQPLLSSGPPLKNSPSPWGRSRKKPIQPATPASSDFKGHKPINSFFKARRVPLAELDPNSFTPSPSQRRVQELNTNSWFTSPLADSPETPATEPAAPANRVLRVAGVQTVASPSSVVRPKRARLCEEDPENGGKPSTGDKSRFFSDASELSPLNAKKAKKNASEFPIFTDESIEDATLAIPDSYGLARPSKLSVFRESAETKDAHLVPEKETQSSSSSCTSTTRASFAWSDATVHTQTPSQTTVSLSRDNSNVGESFKGRLNQFKMEASGEAAVNTLADHTAKTATVAETSVIPESPQKIGAVAVVGSEDCLVPNSEDENDADSDHELETPVKDRMNLGRFLFSK